MTSGCGGAAQGVLPKSRVDAGSSGNESVARRPNGKVLLGLLYHHHPQ